MAAGQCLRLLLPPAPNALRHLRRRRQTLRRGGRPRQVAAAAAAPLVLHNLLQELLVLHPEQLLLSESEVQEKLRPGRIYIAPEDKLEIAQGLLDMGLVEPLEYEELLFFHGEPVTNGTFGVGKGTYLEDQREVMRWIMPPSDTAAAL